MDKNSAEKNYTEEDGTIGQIKVKRSGLKCKLKNVIDNITLEPILIGYTISGSLSRLATQNLNLDKACRVNLNINETICDALIAKEDSKYIEEELAVQKLVASMEVWKSIVLSAMPCLLILFLGAWSDRTGKRKICILMPLLGDILMCLSNILNTYFFYELPVQVTMFMEAIFPAITGNWIVIFMGVFSYIAEITDKKSLTFRVGMVNLCITAGNPIGSALSGILLKYLGYYGIFGISSTIYLICFIYGIIYIKDPKRSEKVLDKDEIFKFRSFMKSFFDTSHVKNTVMVAFKSGPDGRRCKAILVFVTIFFVYGPIHGEYVVRYLFARYKFEADLHINKYSSELSSEYVVRYLFTRYKFNWDAIYFSYFQTYYVCMHGLGAILSITLFSKYLKWDDAVLGIISTCSHILSALFFGIARNGTEFYLAVIIEMMNATSFTALRSISSKLVASDELGKMTSLFNLAENLTSLIYSPLYSWLYMVTLNVNVSILFYLSTLLTTPAFCIFLWFFIQNRKLLKQQKIEEVKVMEAQIINEQQKPLLDFTSTKEGNARQQLESNCSGITIKYKSTE